MDAIFTDTSAWYAIADEDDANHASARAFVESLTLPLITTDFIVDETITLLRYSLGHSVAADIGGKLWNEQLARLVHIDQEVEREAWQRFLKYHDHRFSFTDCTSFVVMDQLGLSQVFVFDSDFESHGTFIKVP